MRITGWLLAAALMTISVLPAGAGDGFCASDGPEAVLECLQTAYESRDLSLMEELFSDDFRFIFKDVTNSWGREQELKTASAMFSEPTVSSIRFEINPSYTLEAGSDPGTWVIDHAAVSFTVLSTKSGKAEELRASEEDVRFLVREITEPDRHFQIYEWWSHRSDP